MYVDAKDFNHNAVLPFGLLVEHISKSMNDFIDFLGFINQQLYSKQIPRLETFLMPANFSSIVGEYMNASIPKYCQTLVKNQYHNGHPDLLPKGVFQNNSIRHAHEGIEIKASRYDRGWQGHNAEECWLMVFVFSSNRATDSTKNIKPAPFKFRLVAGAQLAKTDWLFAGRSETSRRTITASVTKSGYEKMLSNWIYKASDFTISSKAVDVRLPPS